MINVDEIKDLSARELLDKLYGKELVTKKEILEYIELTKVLKQEGIPSELIENTYKLIYDSIDNMRAKVKPNTIMFLNNQLKGQLGKFVKVKEDKQAESSFIKFFREAYPEGKRTKSFTYVLMDKNAISADQIFTTLTYINRKVIKENLTLKVEDKKELIGMIQKLLDKKDIKYINQVKSMDKLLKMLKAKIVKEKEIYKIR